MEELNYEKDVSIDEHSLEIEWKEQASRMGKYCKIKAKAQKKVSLLLEEEKLIRSKLKRKVRKNPEKFGIDKLTESAVDDAVRVQNKFQEINKEIIEAQYELENASGAVTALHQKKAGLEDLVRLLLSNYYAEPSSDPVSDGIKKKINERSANKNIGKKKKKNK